MQAKLAASKRKWQHVGFVAGLKWPQAGVIGSMQHECGWRQAAVVGGLVSLPACM